METNTVVTYEVIDQVSDKWFITRSRHEALDWYEKKCMVYEVHTTITEPSINTQTQVRVVLRWHGNPQKYEV